MKKTVIRLTVICAIATIAMIMSGVFVFAAYNVDSGYCGSNVKWAVTSDGVLNISGRGAMSDYYPNYFYSNLTPPPYEGYSSRIKRIVVSEGVTSIGMYAFFGLDNVTEVTIPRSVRTIYKTAFGKCESIQSIELPEGVMDIGETAFSSCNNLSTITLPTSLKKIGANAFFQCDSLKTVTYLGARDQWNEIEKTGNSFYGVTVNALHEHDYKKGFVRAPTCTKKGFTIYTCSTCGRNLESDYVDPLNPSGHTWVDVKAIPVTCTEDGRSEGQYCSVCGEKEGMLVVTATGHEWVWDHADSTCTRDGFNVRYCMNCGTQDQKEIIPKTNHDWQFADGEEPTCFKEGYTLYRCSNCGQEKKTILPKKEHIWSKEQMLSVDDDDIVTHTDRASNYSMFWGRYCEYLDCSGGGGQYAEYAPIIVKKGKSKYLWAKSYRKYMKKHCKVIRWKSNKKKVVSVNKKTGKIKAKNRGTAYITAKVKFRYKGRYFWFTIDHKVVVN